MITTPTTTAEVPAALERHLRRTLGAWPPAGELLVTTSPARHRPGWDGAVVSVAGLTTPAGTVLSVPAELLDDVPDAALPAVEEWLMRRLGRDGDRLHRIVYRWTSPGDPIADVDDIGAWRHPGDADLPDWLRPFNGGVLVATIDGRHAAGVGIKRHDADAEEIAVVTDAEFRGRSLAVRLVAQATRAIHERGAVALYLHAPDNDGSARVAARVGYPDHGWRLLEP
jgi:GNAT superfamily N-acetyltransferase